MRMQQLAVTGLDIYIFYQEFMKLDRIINDKLKLDITEVNLVSSIDPKHNEYHQGYSINIKYANEVYEALSRVRHPEWYNRQIVQKNTEDLEKLQYQVQPGKQFMELMREQFPHLTPFDIAKMAINHT